MEKLQKAEGEGCWLGQKKSELMYIQFWKELSRLPILWEASWTPSGYIWTMQKAHGASPWSGSHYNLFFSQVQPLLPIPRASAEVQATTLPVWTMVLGASPSYCSSLTLHLKYESMSLPGLRPSKSLLTTQLTPTQADIKDKGTPLP